MASDTAIKGSFRSNYFLAYQGLSEARVKWLWWKKKKKKNLRPAIRDKVADKVRGRGKTILLLRAMFIMETDAYGRLCDASEKIFTLEHWFEREYCKNILKIFGCHLTRLCAWSYEDDWSLQWAKRYSAGASLLWKVMVYRCERGNDCPIGI